jgi:hypothetical protein
MGNPSCDLTCGERLWPESDFERRWIILAEFLLYTIVLTHDIIFDKLEQGDKSSAVAVC